MRDEPAIVRRWPDPETGPLLLHVWIDRIDDRPAVVGVELWGIRPPVSASCLDAVMALAEEAPVRASDVRLPLGAFLDDWVGTQLATGRAAQQLYGKKIEPHVRAIETKYGAQPGERSHLTDDFLERVAEVHAAAVRSGNRKPSLAVWRALGNGYSRSTARSWVHEARRRCPELFTMKESA